MPSPGVPHPRPDLQTRGENALRSHYKSVSPRPSGWCSLPLTPAGFDSAGLYTPACLSKVHRPTRSGNAFGVFADIAIVTTFSALCVDGLSVTRSGSHSLRHPAAFARLHGLGGDAASKDRGSLSFKCPPPGSGDTSESRAWRRARRYRGANAPISVMRFRVQMSAFGILHHGRNQPNAVHRGLVGDLEFDDEISRHVCLPWLPFAGSAAYGADSAEPRVRVPRRFGLPQANRSFGI
jgi:hypothetical protein